MIAGTYHLLDAKAAEVEAESERLSRTREAWRARFALERSCGGRWTEER